MFYADSWIWIELVLRGEKRRMAEGIIRLTDAEECVISPIVLLEAKYRLSKALGTVEADNAMDYIEGIDNLLVAPVNSTIAKYAADLRLRYYKPAVNELSYQDSIHLATALSTGCGTFYSGDPDYKTIREDIKVRII